MDYLALYSSRCKTCGFLDPEETKKWTACHFSKGNTECPAKEVQFVIVGEARRYAQAVAKARKTGDLTKEVKLLEVVGKRSAGFQQKFKEWLAK